MSATNAHDPDTAVEVRVLRQDGPGQASYWQSFRVPHESGLNVIGVLQRIAAEPITTRGERVAPVAYDANCLEEVCGACTMLVNGRTRQGCAAVVDRLLQERPDGIELQPLSKFPVMRDLVVDRTRLFRALEKLQCWVSVDGYYDLGPGPRQSPDGQEQAYPLSVCFSCGCCLEACPQYSKVDLPRRDGESEAEYRQREAREFDRAFIGAAAMNQVVLLNSHPVGAMTAPARMKALVAEGGIQNCGKAANCQAVCPKHIPLMTSWARAGRAATIQAINNLFDG